MQIQAFCLRSCSAARFFTSSSPAHTRVSAARKLGPSLIQIRKMAQSSTGTGTAEEEGLTLADLPKSWRYTSALPADPEYPTPADSHKMPREKIGPRQVRGALFSWVRPERQVDPELLGVSPAALRTLGIRPSEVQTADFLQTAVGNKLHGWNEEKLEGDGYPWAQCYGGFQFGQWAGQLGDGRAISLFETTNPKTGERYEVQLKGAGLTPYSRFADGKAVLRSSIREFVASESLHALGVPTTRALALSLLPHQKVRRETIEPGAIVVRFAQSWLRLGTFDLLRARGDRELIRKLATYVAEDVLGGWEKLPGRLVDPEKPSTEEASPSLASMEVPRPQGSSEAPVRRGVPQAEVEGTSGTAENRFVRLYREICRRNAITVAHWQAYGFMNGVLNTDNTSVMGLSMDYGPFAFVDVFDPSYTPNHDDHLLRYSYQNQPTIIWWNLVRLGESLGELLGAGADVDDPTFVDKGVKDEKSAEPIVQRAETLITQAGTEYRAVFLAEYKRLMCARLGLRTYKESDFATLFSELLDTMEAAELDFNFFFRRLSSLPLSEISTGTDAEKNASLFFYDEGVTGLLGEEKARKRVGAWLCAWRDRVREDWSHAASGVTDSAPDVASVKESRDAERMEAMRRVNPNFVPRGWILDEVIRRVEKEGERDVLKRLMHLSLNPFEESWNGKVFDGKPYEGDEAEEKRWTSNVPKYKRAMQCSCSS